MGPVSTCGDWGKDESWRNPPNREKTAQLREPHFYAMAIRKLTHGILLRRSIIYVHCTPFTRETYRGAIIHIEKGSPRKAPGKAACEKLLGNSADVVAAQQKLKMCRYGAFFV